MTMNVITMLFRRYKYHTVKTHEQTHVIFLFTFIVEYVKYIVGIMSSFCISPNIVGGVMVYVFASSAIERLFVYVYVLFS
jgi:hypothetical protein